MAEVRIQTANIAEDGVPNVAYDIRIDPEIVWRDKKRFFPNIKRGHTDPEGNVDWDLIPNAEIDPDIDTVYVLTEHRGHIKKTFRFIVPTDAAATLAGLTEPYDLFDLLEA